MERRPIRIANFSGYLGDRYSALDEVLSGDPVDVLVGDYLAEITLAALAARYQRDPTSGYVHYFLRQLEPNLGRIAAAGLKVVVNAGGLNPRGLADRVRSLVTSAGLQLRIAYIEGDDLLPRLTGLQNAGCHFNHLDTGLPLAQWGHEPIAANAYLGGWGIAKALREGADIVVCGRVTDASLTLGPAAWWHEWQPADCDQLAGAVAAGHIIECGPQAVGGNFSGFTRLPSSERPGFPIAEVATDGGSVITKHRGDGGSVTVDTVTAQLLYELQGPRYLNPDVTLHVDTVRLKLQGPDRVRLSGIVGSPPPSTTKVAIFALIGYQVVHTVYLTSPDIESKLDLLCAQVSSAVREEVTELVFTPLGVAAPDPKSQWEATVPVRIIATSLEPDALSDRHFGSVLRSLYLSSFPGYYGDSALGAVQPQPRVEYWPALAPAAEIPHRAVLHDGRTIVIAPPSVTQAVDQPLHPEPRPQPRSAGPLRKVPLGTVAHARSGDKGGNCNVGVWVSDQGAWPWLQQTLSSAELRRLLPELQGLSLSRHEFPYLHAVHFVLFGLLGAGASSSLRVDQTGKAVGEYLRAKYVYAPPELLGGATPVTADDTSENEGSDRGFAPVTDDVGATLRESPDPV